MGSLDPQSRVVGDHDGRADVALAKCGTDDPVVGFLGIEAVLHEKVTLDAVHLDLQGTLPERNGGRERPAVTETHLLDGAQGRSGGSTDVVGPGLQPVELLDHRQRDDDVDRAEVAEAGGVRDEHRGVEHHALGGGNSV